MSFLDYLKEHRGEFIDHRATLPIRQGIGALEAEELAIDAGDVRGGGGVDPNPGRRRRRPRTEPRGIRFRHVRPAFSPSPYSDPLPYEEPWERAFR
jgi:hypothetical protein